MVHELLHNVSLKMDTPIHCTDGIMPQPLVSQPNRIARKSFAGFIGRLHRHRLHELGPAAIEAAVETLLQIRHKHKLSIASQSHRHLFDSFRWNAVHEVGLSTSFKVALGHLISCPLRWHHILGVGGLEARCNIGNTTALIRRYVRIHELRIRHCAWIVNDLESKSVRLLLPRFQMSVRQTSMLWRVGAFRIPKYSKQHAGNNAIFTGAVHPMYENTSVQCPHLVT